MPKEAPSTASEGEMGKQCEKKVVSVAFSGCVLCRVRKKKCDEKKPGCEACERLSIVCMGYTVKRPLFLRDKDNLASVRYQITAFLSGKTARRKDASRDVSHSSEPEASEDEVLRFSFSLETKQERMMRGKSLLLPTAKGKVVSRPSSSASTVPYREETPIKDQPHIIPQPAHLPFPLSYSFSPPPLQSNLFGPLSLLASMSSHQHQAYPSSPPVPSPSFLQLSNHYPPPSPVLHQPIPSPPFFLRNEAYFPPPEQFTPVAEQLWGEPGWVEGDLSSRISLLDDDHSPELQSDEDGSSTPGMEIVSRGLMGSPLERLGLPRREFDYLKYTVSMLESLKPSPGTPEWFSQPEHLRRPGPIRIFTDLATEPMTGVKTAQELLYAALRVPACRDVLCCFASRFQAIRGLLDDGKTRPKAWTPYLHPESQALRDRAYESLAMSMANNSIDIISAVYSSQRLILAELIRGGTQGWYQPLLLLRRSVKALMGERAVAGELPPGPLSFTAIYLITYPLWFEVLASISLREESKLYALYEAILLKPDSGIDMNDAMGFSNGGVHCLLQTAALAAWKHRSLEAGTFSSGFLASQGIKIQANINHQWLPSQHPSNPLLPFSLLVFQIHLYGAQLYLSSTIGPPDPDEPLIARSVELMIQVAKLFVDPSSRRCCTLPLTLAGCLCKLEQRDFFRSFLAGRLVGPSLWLFECVWEERDLAEEMEEGSGRLVSWWQVMRELGLEMMMA